MEILIIPLTYLIFWFANLFGILVSDGSFKFPKGLWFLVPFRMGGYESSIDGFVYKQNWMWSKIDWSENPKYKNLFNKYKNLFKENNNV